MTESENVLTQIEAHVATLTINRPEKRNALNDATRCQLVSALEELRQNGDVRVVIVTGAGDKAFVAGADIGEFEARTSVDQFRVMQGPSVYAALDEFPKPVIAAISGFCLGGGLELAMACDIRIAADTAKLGQPEINLGIIPGGGGTQRLPRLAGLGGALKLLYTGELIDAAEALRLRIVDEVVPGGELLKRARALADSIAQKSPIALQLIKEAVRVSVRTSLDEGLRHEIALFGIAFTSGDKREGVQAFREKRPAKFEGR
ncbi:MAG: enoyl-CoA hydratase/isomerase family protein [Gemmatimonadetes bacterium]|nr:enoyl-CoA hydratase/isomerase family protein [Gemmatimonadota bacterium]